MTCGNPNVPVWKGQIVCQYPHMEDGHVAQYQGNNLAKLYNFMTKGMFMNDENMDGGGYGWQCYEQKNGFKKIQPRSQTNTITKTLLNKSNC